MHAYNIDLKHCNTSTGAACCIENCICKLMLKVNVGEIDAQTDNK